ncbi:ATP-grasp domain-containing protein [Clostridium sp. DJ247]|uniref:ATP-grasp domain-containing protein n=1 Tax=Clostridium sp. DJ247 TaxID=2726188 RepID=UPI001625AFAC|nr:ATP-grasp domain-containing protein [Clostridium sp. DJ247]MBC2579031.1 ATP-grasp domain-containing protein [Clostridium sp. DJ247]
MNNEEKYVVVVKLMSKGNEFEIIRELGYKTISFSTELSITEALQVDVPVEVDLNDENAVLEKARELSKKYNIAGVFTLNEYRVPLCARIREVLGIKYGISYEAAFKCRNKKETRKALSDTGVNSVKYKLIRSVDEAVNSLNEIPLPVVIKPSNDAGSKMVYCCQTLDEVRSAVESILDCSSNLVGQKLDEEIILEEFLTGPEFSVETYTFDKETRIIAITAKKVLSPFFPIEAGHTVPARLDDQVVKEIEDVVKSAVSALKIDFSITHIEIKLTPTGPKIVEINARPGGDNIPTLVEMATGFNLHKIALLISLGIPIDEVNPKEPETSSASIRFLMSNADGRVEIDDQLSVLDNPAVTQANISVSDGDLVEKTTSNYNRLGYFIVKGTDTKYAEDLAEDLLSKINIKIR